MKTTIYLGVQASLIFAKLAGIIGWSWWVVLLPLLIPAAFFVAGFSFAAGLALAVLGAWAIITRKH